MFPMCHYQDLALLENQVCLSPPPAPLQSVRLRHYSSLCFYKLVVLSAWVWQQLDVPCFCPMPFLLHSHSMTSVKRASSFHENSHSTRTRSRVSRKPVILNVSRFSKIMSHATQEKKNLPGQHSSQAFPHHTPRQTTWQAGRQVLLLWPVFNCSLDPSLLGLCFAQRTKKGLDKAGAPIPTSVSLWPEMGLTWSCNSLRLETNSSLPWHIGLHHHVCILSWVQAWYICTLLPSGKPFNASWDGSLYWWMQNLFWNLEWGHPLTVKNIPFTDFFLISLPTISGFPFELTSK